MATKSASPLREIRRSRTMSQEDLARLVGLTQQAIATYESGRVTPPVHVQIRLAAILGSTPEILFPDDLSTERTA